MLNPSVLISKTDIGSNYKDIDQKLSKIWSKFELNNLFKLTEENKGKRVISTGIADFQCIVM